MALINRPRPPIGEDENPYWMSFSDLMSGLLIVFILAAVALILELTQKSMVWDEILEQVKAAEDARDELVGEIQRELEEQGIQVIINDGTSVITIPERQLQFASAEFEIPQDPETRDVVRIIGEVLNSALRKGNRVSYLDTVFVEGHTDCENFEDPRIKGNWGLSTFRAISVWQSWITSGTSESIPLDDLKNVNNFPLFSVSGYAATRPAPGTTDVLCEKQDDDILGKNRRIDLRFTVRRPSLEDYEAFREDLQ